MTRPPRLAERVLAALGADPYLRDVVLGDLAEEFAERVLGDGERSARQWYFAEAIRNVPFFLRSWRRHARWRGASRLLGVAAATYSLMFVIGGGVGIVGYALWTMLGLPSFDLRHLMATGGEIVFLMPVALALGESVLGGVIAAWLDDQAPILSAATFGFAWAAVFSAGEIVADFGPLWYRAIVPMVFMVGSVAGALLRLARRSDVPAVASD